MNEADGVTHLVEEEVKETVDTETASQNVLNGQTVPDGSTDPKGLFAPKGLSTPKDRYSPNAPLTQPCLFIFILIFCKDNFKIIEGPILGLYVLTFIPVRFVEVFIIFIIFSFVAFIYCLFLWFCMPTVIVGMPPIRRKDLTTPE